MDINVNLADIETADPITCARNSAQLLHIRKGYVFAVKRLKRTLDTVRQALRKGTKPRANSRRMASAVSDILDVTFVATCIQNDTLTYGIRTWASAPSMYDVDTSLAMRRWLDDTLETHPGVGVVAPLSERGQLEDMLVEQISEEIERD